MKLVKNVDEIDFDFFPTCRYIITSKSGVSDGKILQVCYSTLEDKLIAEFTSNIKITDTYTYFNHMMKPVFKQLAETCGFEYGELDDAIIMQKFIDFQIKKRDEK